MDKNVLYNGRKIFYRVVGEGTPVVFIHGFGEDGTVWENQVDFLKNKFRLIIPDIPGSGRSEMIDDMSMEGLAESIHFLLQEESSNTLREPWGAALGHSMGGYILLALIEKYPQLFTGFGLVHSSAFADTEEKKATRRKGMDFIREHGAKAFLQTAIPNLFSDHSKENNPHIMKDFISRLPKFSDEALVSYYEAMMSRPDRTSILKTGMPVLFLLGKYDTAIPLSDGLKQSHLPEISYIHILENSGHMGMLEEPVEMNRILDEFLLHSKNIGTPSNQ